ncbi:tuberous sclerosis 2 protein [Diplogelasinospora grovesii]|uniref:Tuberous sclerosis 2 protein n=1 Tax=Diplogelasinospora grovesii TaxID=303347 RepID=A0AAN6NFE1_9PEZI|nr:tuberous sclerosis 2 protein [Diplogelasinospora grovesii]
MLRRLASLGQQAADDQEPMSPSPGDDAHSQEARGAGGFAGVLRGLTGGKLTKSPPPTQQHTPTSTNPSLPFPEHSDGAPTSSAPSGLPPEKKAVFEQLRNGTLNERVAAASSLRYAIADFPLSPILHIWHAGKDLIDPAKPAAARVVGWELLNECVKYASATDLDRRGFFQTLTAPANAEDFHLQLAALEDLTNHGRNVSGFYFEIFPLLTNWLQQAFQAVKGARRQASRGTSKSSKGKTLPTGEDKNFTQLFAFLKDVIKFNFKIASDKVIGGLVDVLCKICMSTSVEDDLRACISIMDALVTYGTIPNDKLKDCIGLLSSIHSLVATLRKDAWHTLSNICISHHGQYIVKVLLDNLRNFGPVTEKEKEKDAIREVRGALSVLNKLLSKSAKSADKRNYPTVQLTLLVDGLSNILKSNSPRIATDVLQLINSLIERPDGSVNPLIADERWSAIFSVAAQCAEQKVHVTTIDSDVSIRPLATKDDDEMADTIGHELKRLVACVERLVTQNRSNLPQRDECINFFAKVPQSLPDSAATLLLDHFKANRRCLPSDAEWMGNLKLVLEGLFLDRSRRPLTRLQALEVIIDSYGFLCLVPDSVNEGHIADLVKRVLSGISDENDTVVLQKTVAFLVDVAERADMHLFNDIVDALKSVIASERDKVAVPVPSTQQPNQVYAHEPVSCFSPQSLSDVATRGYVHIFMRSMNSDSTKATRAFTALVHIARSNACETDARLTAMKMLFRLRADYQKRVYLLATTENEGLAGSLYRTETSLARKLAEDAAQPPRLSRSDQGGQSRTSRGISFTQGQTGERGLNARPVAAPRPSSQKPQRLWSWPDPEALPEPPRSRPSHLLLTHKGDGNDEASELRGAVLDMGSWLQALLSLFQGCDWEVYSFMLVHLPAQLSCHAIFKGAIPQILELRRLLCELIRSNTFQEPPSFSGLRRPDVANCLFHSLVMLLSYHEHFQKSEEDEIVKTFMHGITDKTAKTCIHCLSVCCHELPLSISKSLVTILQRMSQVITQPFVAMHILEFLACLSRMHSLYSNFRDDEYRIVFAICFRYLQYVRDKKHSTRSSHAGEPSGHWEAATAQPTDDLPQYVYALAYHVITFWFLAVKINDRPNHIGWIAKNLFTDPDGSASNDEQAQITLDFMQRVAFSDAGDSTWDPLFKEQNFGEIVQKRWVIGNSIVTIRQAKESGWAEITRRYPSGTSSFAVRVQSSPTPAHQARNDSDAGTWEGQQGTTILPSHLLMQLLAPIPQIYDPTARPIPLPDEDAIDRAIRNFDRNSTVDGHKVGVIYIKEGQTHEVEILANTTGSPDYLEFLSGLGTLTMLKGAPFNTQGLDREFDIDGQYTYCWRDRVTEIVFHVTTQMPTNLERDPQCIGKKRHIGNDFVNIIFNDSGAPFKFDTFPSQFNYVYIVITPTPHLSAAAIREKAKKKDDDEDNNPWLPFFMVQVMSRPGFPEISPAAEPKLVSLKALPSFVRLLAINASVFSHVWANREGGEHVSPWRSRLQEINRLRDRYGPKQQHQHQMQMQMQPLYPSPPPSALGGMAQVASPGISPGMSPGIGGDGAGGGGGLGGGGSGGGVGTRPSSTSVRDSFSSSLRRSSVATFFTTASTATDQQTASALASHRSSMLSTAATTDNNTEIMSSMQMQMQLNGAEALVESVDFSKWT